ncbi:MAG: hypothetical protein J6P61_08120 [Erysipelotrichaceae bacterium]|nr:hypothetical protein [Erysipelotrichaceae bacterium]
MIKHSHRYDDIIDIDFHLKHKPMSIDNRAAQFAPFAALKGYDDQVKEVARYTDTQPILSDEAITQINEKLNVLLTLEIPKIFIDYFVADHNKSGGSIRQINDYVTKIDLYNHCLHCGKQTIPFENILKLEIDI